MILLLAAAAILGLLLGALARQMVVVLPRMPGLEPDEEDESAEPKAAPKRLLPYALKAGHLVPVIGALAQARVLTDSPKARIWLPAFDLTVMVLVAVNSLVVGWTPLFFVLALLIADFTAIMFIDWQHHAIFPFMIYPAVVLALAGSLLEGNIGWPAALAGLLIGAGLFMLLFVLGKKIYHTSALGFGDVMLAALIGASLGYPRFMAALLIGAVAGALIGSMLVLMRRLSLKSYIPYGAYLSAGTLFYLVFRSGF